MKKLIPLLVFIYITSASFAQIVITEISYNPPESGTDSLEYIELYNAGAQEVDLTGYTFTAGIDYTFDVGQSLAADGYLIVCESNSAMMNVFGISGVEWEGGLSNSGETITLADGDGNVVDEVPFDDTAPWPSSTEGTDGEGASIELCEVSGDNSLGESWRAATNDIGVIIDGKSVLGTPGASNTVSCVALPDVMVDVSGLSFTPADITINVGETVRWTNTGGNHNVNGSTGTYPDNPESFFSGPPAPAPWTFDNMFNTPGVYNYQCDLHVGAGMVGTVTVVGEVEPAPPVVITEIMYNDPGMDDAIEFVELYNNGDVVVDLTGASFTAGVDLVFGDVQIDAGEFLIVAADPTQIENFFGISDAIAWTSGGLSNSGELLQLSTSTGTVIDEVEYADGGDWPEDADGFGFSLTLCDVDSDNTLASNWRACAYDSGQEIGGFDLFAHPSQSDRCLLSIGEVTTLDANQAITYMGEARLTGTVIGVNLRPSGLQFTINDEDGDGISVFNPSDDLGYVVNEGDIITIEGQITQFNGLAQIHVDLIEDEIIPGTVPNALVVTGLGEDTESQLVTLENVHLVDTDEWTGVGSGFNVRVTDGSVDTFEVRIDADVDLFDKGYPQGTFSVTGIGGQFDNSSPYDSGYQLLPRYMEDITPYNEFVIEFPEYSIPTVTTEDENGVADSLERKATLSGIAHGINFRPSGLQFWLLDEDNNGIQVFSLSDDLGYTVTEGDELVIKGTIDQFNGLTEIVPNEIEVISTQQDLVTPLTLDMPLSEDLESKLVRYNSLELLDPDQWIGDGSSFAITLVDASGSYEIEVFIDADTELASMPTAPGAGFNVTGLVSQSDSESPFDEGYNLWVRYSADLEVINSTNHITDSDLINVYPNPTDQRLYIDSDMDIDYVELSDQMGHTIMKISNSTNGVNTNALPSGIYILRVVVGSNSYVQRIVKK